MTLLFKIGASPKNDYYVPGLPFYFAAILLLISQHYSKKGVAEKINKHENRHRYRHKRR